MRQKIVVGNWKMNTTRESGRKLVEALVAGCGQETTVRVGVCPPACYLPIVGEQLQGSAIGLGAQNCHFENSGAFTGEIAPQQLADLGCRYVILGHSERRHVFGETDAFINQKVKAALAVGLEVILCLGEKLDERQANKTNEVLDTQLNGSLSGLDADGLDKVILAYEPVWAIGTGVTASPEQAQAAHVYIRGWLKSHYNEKTSQRTPIQYGGSVTARTAAGLFPQPDIDGGLIGGASLKPEEFLQIVAAGR